MSQFIEPFVPGSECIKVYRKDGYTIRLFDTFQPSRRGLLGRTVLAIQVKKGRKVIYQQNDFEPSPLYCDDSLQSVGAAAGFAGYDLDDEYLSMIANDLEERRPCQ